MKRSLLIVDDVKMNRDILKKILGDEYETYEAGDGREALACMSRTYKELSAVLLDLSMPLMDGFAVLEHIQDDPLLKPIPVIVTTGQTEDSSEVKALKLGASDYIPKPYNPAIIKQRVSSVINLRETAATVNELQHDRLTGLYSRNTFFEKAGEMILERAAGYYVMACFDIDNFKVINDQYGTAKGDWVLKYLADIFRAGFGAAGGVCCRIMADKFAVLYPRSFMESASIKELQHIAKVLDGSMQPISFSVGRYIVDDPSLSVSAMYDRASLAVSTVKGRYDRNTALFDESMRDRLLAQQRIVNEMKPALESGQFEPWFQPQYNHATGRLIGAEALARWRHPERGMISPGVFVPLFEKNGFIYELDKYIWEQVCICLSRWISEGRKPLPISVNISRYDVFRDDLIEVLTGLVQSYGVPFELLRLEITESAFSKSTSQIIDTVKQLIALGFTVEIDDFGSGYSSLNTLKEVPAQIVKLDMKFLEDTDRSERGGSIVESVVRMAKWLNVSVIAEGVETRHQADFLQSVGCLFVQGYLYAKPMELASYEALAAGSDKQHETPVMETVEHLDSNAFWNPESIDTLIFNSYIGSACVLEYANGRIELIRANNKYIPSFEGAGITLEDALKLNWSDYMDDEGRAAMADMISASIGVDNERTIEFAFNGLPGCAERVYLRATMRVIARMGRRSLIYCINENVTARRAAERRKQEVTDQLALLERIAHELLTQRDAEAGIRMLLDRMLEYFRGDRCYIFEFDFERGVTNNTYEICADGVTSEKERLQNVPLDRVAFWLHAFDKEHFVWIGDVGALGDDRPEKELLEEQGIRSLVAVPLFKAGELKGFIGIDDPLQKQKDIASLSALGDYAAVMMTRRDMEEDINSENLEKLAIMDGIPGGFVRMEIQPDGTSIPLYFSEGLEKLLCMDQAELSALYGRNAMAGVHPDDLKAVQRDVAEMLRVGEGHNITYRLKKGGGYVWVTIFGKVQKNRSEKTYLNVYYADATEQKRLMDIQIELLDNLPCGAALFEITPDRLSVMHMNRHYWELVRRTPQKCSDINVMDAVYPDDRRIVTMEVAAARKQRRGISCDIRILCGDSSYRMFHIVGRIVSGENGLIVVCATYTPVSDDILSAQEMLPVLLSAIMESTSDFSFVKDEELRYLCASNAFAKLVGLDDATKLVGKTDYELFDKATAEKYRSDDEALLESGESIIDMVESIPSLDGVERHSSTSKYLLRDSGGHIIGLYGVGRDITEEQLVTEKLRISEEEYRLAAQHTGSTVCRFTISDRTLFLPPDVAEARGLDGRIGDMPEGMLKLGVISPESEQTYIEFYKRILSGEKTGSMIFRCRMPEGICWFEEHFSTVFSLGKPLFAVLSYTDVTERQEKELIYKKWQQSLSDKDPDAYTLYRCNISKDSSTDTLEGNLLRIDFSVSNRTFNERTRRYAKRYIFEDDRLSYIALLDSNALLAGYYRGVRYKTAEYRELLPDGGIRWLKLTVELVEYPNSSDVEAYLMYENIDDAKKAELQIKTHAETDPLTGILNRATFAERMDRLIAARKPDAISALLMLDLDDFKLLNDCYGHVAGDEALIEVGRRLQAALRPNDLVGRLGGDEFLVYMSDLPDRAVIESRAAALCSMLERPLECGAPLATSLGISVCPDDGSCFETLYMKVDAALYNAKRTGKNRHAFYSEDMGTKGTHS